MKRLTTLLVAIGIILFGPAAYARSHSSSKSKTAHSSRKTTTSSVTNASDLSIFNVQGKVKSITYNVKKDYCAPSPFYYNKPILFSENGECTNIKEIFKATMESKGRITLKRDKNGHIELILNKESDGEECESIYFEWKDGNVTKFGIFDCKRNSERTVYLYYSDNRISKMTSGSFFDGLEENATLSFSDFKNDSYGNWVECKIKIVSESSFDGEDLGSETSYLTIKRTISYYN